MVDPKKGASGFLHALSVPTEPECVGSAAHARLPGGPHIDLRQRFCEPRGRTRTRVEVEGDVLTCLRLDIQRARTRTALQPSPVRRANIRRCAIGGSTMRGRPASSIIRHEGHRQDSPDMHEPKGRPQRSRSQRTSPNCGQEPLSDCRDGHLTNTRLTTRPPQRSRYPAVMFDSVQPGARLLVVIPHGMPACGGRPHLPRKNPWLVPAKFEKRSQR